MIIIAHSADQGLRDSIDYWRNKGLDIDFIPYRIYEINNDLFFEFFSKPYDNQINPKNLKCVVFDTNRSYDEEAYKHMLKKNRVSAFWNRKEAIYSLTKNDYVFLSHKHVGIIAIGKVISDVKNGDYEGEGSELYVDAEYSHKLSDIDNPQCLISYSQIKELIGKSFFHARINKVPYLTKEEVAILIKFIDKSNAK